MEGAAVVLFPATPGTTTAGSENSGQLRRQLICLNNFLGNTFDIATNGSLVLNT